MTLALHAPHDDFVCRVRLARPLSISRALNGERRQNTRSRAAQQRPFELIT